MTLSTFAAFLVAFLDLCVGARYSSQLFRGKTRPRIATWLIFEMGVVMSLVAYFTAHDHSFLKAALNLTDAAVVTFILASLFIVQRGQRIVFTTNEQLCLLIACITLAAWAITRTAWVGFAGFQLVMSIAYVPTIESLWHAQPGPAPEPVETWTLNAVAAAIGIAVALSGRHDYMAMLYPLRAFLLCIVVVVLVERWKSRNRRIPRPLP